MTLLAWLILWLPFFAAVAIFLIFKWQPRIAGILATAAMFLDFGLCLLFCTQACRSGLEHFFLESSVNWIALGGVEIEFGILINGLSLLMLLIVTGIGALIFLYSLSYMEGEEGYSRYFACLALFAFSMLGIVLSNNLIQVFIFWELVGLSSYLLIGFYYEKESAAVAGKKAFMTTRVGDVGMMIGILILFHQPGVGSFNIPFLSQQLHSLELPPSMMTAICLLLFMGVAGKSAQVPLHVWLPDAMEGPTPVSALMHAATMVAAGVFLLARLFFIFEKSSTALEVIAWIGVITAFIPGTIALVQNDIKRVLAYSTLSQLGYMVMAIGLGSPEAGMFHLTTHAFFKALLFLAAGSLIHGTHTQDLHDIAHHHGLLKKMPVTAITFLIGTAALMGIPPLSGFYSKEAILSVASHGPRILFIIALAVVFLTSFYMGRVSTIIFFSKKSHGYHHDHPVHESPLTMTLPLMILALFSVSGGWIPWHLFLEPSPLLHYEGEALEWVSILIAISGFVAAWLIYRRSGKEKKMAMTKVLQHKYFFDDFYDALVLIVQENIALFCDTFEKIAVVQWGTNGTALVARGVGRLLASFQTGIVQFYALIFITGVTALIYLLILSGGSQ